MIAATPPPPPVAFAQSFAVIGARVTPRRAFVGGRPVRIRLRLRRAAEAAEPAEVRVRIERRGRLVRGFRVRVGEPRQVVEVRWRGRTSRSSLARDGRYRVHAGPVGGRLRRIGGFVLRGHVYPVRGPHGFRGSIGTFGAPRSGGRSHEGFDMNARCGTPVVAARAGIVVRRRFDPQLNGHFVIVKAPGQRLAYWYSHLRSPARVRLGQRVRTGQRLGEVGATGNAITVGCHLHFELHGPRGPFDPLPRLRAWDAWMTPRRSSCGSCCSSASSVRCSRRFEPPAAGNSPRMAKDHGSSIKDDEQYEALRDEGASKEKAARIANTSRQGAAERGGESGSYDDWSKDDLEQRAAEIGIEGRSKMDKGELIDALRNH